LNIPGLSGQREFVVENLSKIEGVAAVKAHVQENNVEVDFDPTRIDPSQMLNSMRQAGIESERRS
jgi:copper chaperone CopZ